MMKIKVSEKRCPFRWWLMINVVNESTGDYVRALLGLGTLDVGTREVEELGDDVMGEDSLVES